MAIEIGEDDVKEHEIGPNAPHNLQRRCSVFRFTDNPQAVSLAQGPRLGAETGVVVDKDNALIRRRMLAHRRRRTSGLALASTFGLPPMAAMGSRHTGGLSAGLRSGLLLAIALASGQTLTDLRRSSIVPAERNSQLSTS